MTTQRTVTLLFTDIEGSTRLLQHLGERYPAVLEEHRRLLRSAVHEWNGREIDSQGDSFFFAFAHSAEAIAASAAAQRALARHPWPEGAPLRVRMGVHAGTPTATAWGYVGLDVHRAARISAAAHGGQVLLSQAACDQAEGSLPSDASFRYLGEHRLKDLPRPEALFQLVLPDLPDEFPPVRSLDAHPNNLPLQLTSFVGREAAIAELKEVLRPAPHVAPSRSDAAPAHAGQRSTLHTRREVAAPRLVTLTGAGGCGKTRLALQVASELLEEYPSGVWLVELAPVSEPERVPETVASALGVREEPGRTLTETLLDNLRSRQTLLILDNCEHLIAACARLAELLLQACPAVRILATSREALAVGGETVWRVPSLSLPGDSRPEAGGRRQGAGSRQAADTGSQAVVPPSNRLPSASCLLPTTDCLLASEAVRLFLDRATAVAPTFTVTPENAAPLAQLCHRLDGIPLAIELAAARVKALKIETIASRLDDRFRLLTIGSRTALPRQQTLKAAIDWSYDLLSYPERVLLCRLSVFAGGCTLEAAEAVCSDCGSRMVDGGLSDRSDTQVPLIAPFIRNPQSTIRNQEVLDLLAALVDKSLLIYEEYGAEPRYRLLETIREYGREKLRDTTDEAEPRRRHRDWYLQLAEQAGPELATSAQAIWLDRLEEEHDNLRAALAWSMEGGEIEAGLRLGAALGPFWAIRGYFTEGRSHLSRLLALDDRGLRMADGGLETDERQQTNSPRESGVLSPSPAPNPQSATRNPQSRVSRAKVLQAAGTLAQYQGDFAAARAYFEENLGIQRSLSDLRGIAASLGNLGNVAWRQGERELARARYEEGLTHFRQLEDQRGIAQSLNNLGLLAMDQADYETAQRFLEASLALKRARADQRGVALSLMNLANLAKEQGSLERARALYDESLRIWREIGDKRGIAGTLNNLGNVALCLADLETARALCEESLAINRELGNRLWEANNLEVLGSAAEAQGEYEAALSLYEQVLAIRRETGDRREIPSSFFTLARLALARGRAERAAQLLGAAAALRESLGAALSPSDLAEYEQQVAVARATLGEGPFAAAVSAGRSLPLDEAIEMALAPEPAGIHQ